MRIFVLEDDSYRINFFIEKFCDCNVIVTESAYSAIEYLKDNMFDYIFLDHDLGEANGCGLDVAEYLYNNPDNDNNYASIVVHSWNIPAAQRMLSLLPDHSKYIPFDVVVLSEIETWQIKINDYIMVYGTRKIKKIREDYGYV